VLGLPSWSPQQDLRFVGAAARTFDTLSLLATRRLVCPSTIMAKNPLFAILWLVLLFFIAWPVAFFCAGFWVLLQVR
jgi:hypothetical protein